MDDLGDMGPWTVGEQETNHDNTTLTLAKTLLRTEGSWTTNMCSEHEEENVIIWHSDYARILVG